MNTLFLYPLIASLLTAELSFVPDADRCIIEDYQIIQLSDFCQLACGEHSLDGRCLLNLQPDSDTDWRLLLGGRNEIVLIDDGAVISRLVIHHPPMYSNYVIMPNISNDYVLIGYLHGWSGPTTMRLYSFDSGTYFNVIEDRSQGRSGDVVSSFESILAGDRVYFVDAAAFFGGYSETTGSVEYDYTSSGDDYIWHSFPKHPVSYSVSEDGDLFVAGMRETPCEVVGFNLTEGFMWAAECQSIVGISISRNSERVAVDRFSDGVLLIDGMSGEIIDTYLRNCYVAPSYMCLPPNFSALSISSNGRFIGTTFTAGDSSEYVTGESYLTCINTQIADEQQYCWPVSDLGMSSPKVIDVADDGTMLVRNTVTGGVQYSLIRTSGDEIWNSGEIASSKVADLACTGTGYIIGYVDEILREAIIVRLKIP